MQTEKSSIKFIAILTIILVIALSIVSIRISSDTAHRNQQDRLAAQNKFNIKITNEKLKLIERNDQMIQDNNESLTIDDAEISKTNDGYIVTGTQNNEKVTLNFSDDNKPIIKDGHVTYYQIRDTNQNLFVSKSKMLKNIRAINGIKYDHEKEMAQINYKFDLDEIEYTNSNRKLLKNIFASSICILIYGIILTCHEFYKLRKKGKITT